MSATGPEAVRTPTAVVTGAAGGIGRALSEQLSRDGRAVLMADLDGRGLDAAAGELPDAKAVELDVADPAAFDDLATRIGPVDVLCLNAGVLSADSGLPWESDADEWRRVLDVNLGGVVNGLRSFVPAMVERDRPAVIIITASLAGAATWPGGGPYAASKHAVLAVAEQAALGLADTAITVTALCPALVRSGMSDEGEEPAVVARAALHAAADGRFAVVADEWSAAVRSRAETLVTGDQPQLPIPT